MQKLLPWFTCDTLKDEYEKDDISGDSIFDYYRCTALQDMKNVKKGDFIDYIRVDMINLEISGMNYGPNYNEETDDDNDYIEVFRFPFSLQLKLD